MFSSYKEDLVTRKYMNDRVQLILDFFQVIKQKEVPRHEKTTAQRPDCARR